MPRPQRSTRDTWLDQFADFDLESQAGLIDVCELLHRQAKRRTAKVPPNSTAPGATGVDLALGGIEQTGPAKVDPEQGKSEESLSE